ncbi:phosphoribosylglycinamide formyltransferase [Chromatiales bacterium (ex Bugula neritina AB1)]|nr:phosphoribosylglycinamide formyltransferase [Chromatiales bacterium (ex Bugula neritina AB1)]
MSKCPDTAAPARSLVILISGRGSNFQTIHQACLLGAINADIALVISNRPDAAGLVYAREQKIRTRVLNHSDYTSRNQYDLALSSVIDTIEQPFVILAGFMRRLTGSFTRRYTSRLINIHPSLLPLHPGLDTHRAAIEHGDRWHGCSVHYVTEKLDGGPVIARAVVPLYKQDTPQLLAARVLAKEHMLYPHVIQLCLTGRIEWKDGHILHAGIPLQYPLAF